MYVTASGAAPLVALSRPCCGGVVTDAVNRPTGSSTSVPVSCTAAAVVSSIVVIGPAAVATGRSLTEVTAIITVAGAD